jgi:hypothetical protein
VEPERSKFTRRWSGTMDHTGKNIDAASQLVYRFTHYVYEETDHQLVFADMQGQPMSPTGACEACVAESE